MFILFLFFFAFRRWCERRSTDVASSVSPPLDDRDKMSPQGFVKLHGFQIVAAILLESGEAPVRLNPFISPVQYRAGECMDHSMRNSFRQQKEAALTTYCSGFYKLRLLKRPAAPREMLGACRHRSQRDSLEAIYS